MTETDLEPENTDRILDGDQSGHGLETETGEYSGKGTVRWMRRSLGRFTPSATRRLQRQPTLTSMNPPHGIDGHAEEPVWSRVIEHGRTRVPKPKTGSRTARRGMRR